MDITERLKSWVEPRPKKLARSLIANPGLELQKHFDATSDMLGLGERRAYVVPASEQTIEIHSKDFELQLKEGGAPLVWSSPLAAEDAYGLINSVFVTGQLPKRGTKELMAAYSIMPRLRSAVHRIARDVSCVPMKLYFPTTKYGKRYLPEYKALRDHSQRHQMKKELQRSGDLTELAPDHPAYVFLRAGNPKMPGRQSRFITQVFYLLKGDTYNIIARDSNGAPARWYPIPPYWEIMSPTAFRPWHRFQYGTWYCDVPESECMWWADPDPLNPYGRGTGVGESLATNLETEHAGARHQNRMLRQNATPDSIVMVEGAGKTALEDMELRWNERHQGPERAGRPHFTGSKIDVKQLQSSFRDMELIKLREFEKQTISDCFHVPKELDGNLESANRAAAGAVRYFYLEFTITPWVEDERDNWQYAMQSLFNGEVAVDYEPFVPADDDRIQAVMTTFPQAFKVKEARELAGFDPSGDERDEEYLAPIPTAPPALGASPTPSPVKPTTTPAPKPPKPSDEDGNEDESEPEGRSFLSPRRLLPEAKALSREQQDRIDAIVQSVLDSDAFRGVGDNLGDIITQAGDSALVDIAIDYQGSADVPAALNAGADAVRAYVGDQFEERLGAINQATADYLADFLATQIEKGATAEEIGDALDKSTNFAFGDARAARITSMEVTGAANFGRLEAFKQSGVVDQKLWVHYPGILGGVRESHEDLDGIQIPVDDDFTDDATGATGQYPGGFGDPESDANCCCELEYVLSEEEDVDDDKFVVEGVPDHQLVPEYVEKAPKLKALREHHALLLQTKTSEALAAQKALVKSKLRLLP